MADDVVEVEGELPRVANRRLARRRGHRGRRPLAPFVARGARALVIGKFARATVVADDLALEEVVGGVADRRLARRRGRHRGALVVVVQDVFCAQRGFVEAELVDVAVEVRMDGVVLGGEPPADGGARSEHAADGDIRGLGVELGQLPEGLDLGAVDAERELRPRVREDRAVVVPLVVEPQEGPLAGSVPEVVRRDLVPVLAGAEHAKVRAKVGVGAFVAEVDLEAAQVPVDAELEDDVHRIARFGGGLLGPEADAPRLLAAEGAAAVGVEFSEARVLRPVRKAAFAELEDVERPWVPAGAAVGAGGVSEGGRRRRASRNHRRLARARRRVYRGSPTSRDRSAARGARGAVPLGCSRSDPSPRGACR